MSQSTVLERILIALIQSAGHPRTMTIHEVKDLVDTAGRFDQALNGESFSSIASVPDWEHQLHSLLDSLGKHAVRVRQGGGNEDVLQSIAVTCTRMANRLDVCPEPPPDELPVLDERRVIMTREQFKTRLYRAIAISCLWHGSGRTAHEMADFIINTMVKDHD